jgi:hypothetical protein
MPGANLLVGSAQPDLEPETNLSATTQVGGGGFDKNGSEFLVVAIVLGAVGMLILFRVAGFQAVIGVQVGK